MQIISPDARGGSLGKKTVDWRALLATDDDKTLLVLRVVFAAVMWPHGAQHALGGWGTDRSITSSATAASRAGKRTHAGPATARSILPRDFRTRFVGVRGSRARSRACHRAALDRWAAL